MRGAAALFAMVLLAGCQPGAGPAGSGASARPSESFSAPARFGATLGALTPGYTFEATVTVGGKVATHASGRWVKGAGEFVIEAQGGSITYRAVPPRAWVYDEDGGWVELDAGAPLGNPIDALLEPKSIATVGGERGGLDIQATYPAAALGLSGDPVRVDVTLGADGSVIATYRIDTPGGTAVSETRMTPAANLQPVLAPSAG